MAVEVFSRQLRSKVVNSSAGMPVLGQQPALEGAEESVGVKLHVEVQVGVLAQNALHGLPQNGGQNVPEVLGEGVLPIHAEGLAVKGAVFVKVGAQILQEFPLGAVVLLLEDSHALGVVNPVNQVVFIFKVVVKALAVHVAGLAYIADADFGKGRLLHQLFQGGSQRPLGDIGIRQKPTSCNSLLMRNIPQNREKSNSLSF